MTRRALVWRRSRSALQKRLVTIDLARDDAPKNPHFFINPEIVWTSEEKSTYEEGCLSIPEVYEEVERPAECKVAFLDRDGAEQGTALRRPACHLYPARG